MSRTTEWFRVTAIVLLTAILVAVLILPPRQATTAAPPGYTVIDDETVDPYAGPLDSPDYQFLLCEDALERRQMLQSAVFNNERFGTPEAYDLWADWYTTAEQDIETYCFSHSSASRVITGTG